MGASRGRLSAAPPAICVHGPADVAAALAPGLPVTLLSGRGAGGYAGVLWWRALVAHAVRHPGVLDILDCGDGPGHAMAALREGQRRLVCAPGPALPALLAAAAECGAIIQTVRPAALDMSHRGAARRTRAWLRMIDAPPG